MKLSVIRRDLVVREMLDDLTMLGALETADDILAQTDSGSVTVTETIEKLHSVQNAL